MTEAFNCGQLPTEAGLVKINSTSFHPFFTIKDMMPKHSFCSVQTSRNFD